MTDKRSHCFHCCASQGRGVTRLEQLQIHAGRNVTLFVKDIKEAKQTRFLSPQLYLCRCCRALWSSAVRNNFCQVSFDNIAFIVVILAEPVSTPSNFFFNTKGQKSPYSSRIYKTPYIFAVYQRNFACAIAAEPCGNAPTTLAFVASLFFLSIITVECFHCQRSAQNQRDPLAQLLTYRGRTITLFVYNLKEIKKTRFLSNQLDLCRCCKTLFHSADQQKTFFSCIQFC